MLRNSVEDPKESKFSSTHFSENKNFNSNSGVTLKNEEYYFEYNNDSSSKNAESKMERLKTEDNIDIIYEDVKPEICQEKSNGTEIGPNFSHEPLIDSETWPQQNIEEDGAALGWDNN
ncbi:hypothetical protein JTB14_014119 [Gonioctena quinquepunctata]|nr:hypothetical protein JTB14_014119 [Gonioctena quinquepunctata]